MKKLNISKFILLGCAIVFLIDILFVFHFMKFFGYFAIVVSLKSRPSIILIEVNIQDERLFQLFMTTFCL